MRFSAPPLSSSVPSSLAGAPPLSRQVLVERVLTLWVQENRDTHSIAAELGIDEDEVCKIIEQSEGRRP
ncbi:hypothetical protein CN204_32580 [Sinorhizobium meliloti]|uniref:Uncharacterized protein n=1 Tax=Sinorhizobium meliloti (strain SM11) TaxID=707241 RepID=F7XA63_SINMM|nr:hypothetical protein SM11_chr1892 [Sinorhizobium meliloti SM11]ARS72101.1 hypothetical protein SMRU11_35170 [Sinorhizobium meliloti RU11/001]ASP51390.1 hypothetical protein CDO31_07280 [Sinorhizobium meliloti]MDX1083322.1 hypothetical protein [Sinorhizobium medicae]PST26053.1 hypothetical protein C7U62_12805 [Mesorhizobium loti]